MREFLAMGGYAQWVWTAFGMAVIVLVANVYAAGRRYKRAIEQLRLRNVGATDGGGR